MTAAAPGALPRCPAWCDARFCRPDGRVVRHSSAPVKVTTGDAVYTIHLWSSDELAFPAEWGQAGPWLALSATSTEWTTGPVGPEGAPLQFEGSLDPGDLRCLVDTLTIHLLTARVASGVTR